MIFSFLHNLFFLLFTDTLLQKPHQMLIPYESFLPGDE